MEMDDEWIIGILDKIKVGHISTLNGEQPFINPSSFFIIKINTRSIFIPMHMEECVLMPKEALKYVLNVLGLGRLLPSNLALEMSFQYECVIVYGHIRVIDSMIEKREVLNGLLHKYFNEMISGKDYRPITDEELKQTSVYGIRIDSWSGKKNWEEKAEQAEDGEWPDLDKNGLIDTRSISSMPH